MRDVDDFRLRKVQEGRLNATSINKLIGTLAAILEDAVEHGVIDRNPAKRRRRRLPSVDRKRSWIDGADHFGALLDGASELDRTARARHGQRRALLATLAFAGLRIGEALGLEWRDVNLARGTLTIREGKTAAASRTVNMLDVLRDELSAYRARLDDPPAGALVFGTSTGAMQGATNIRKRVLAPAAARANRSSRNGR